MIEILRGKTTSQQNCVRGTKDTTGIQFCEKTQLIVFFGLLMQDTPDRIAYSMRPGSLHALHFGTARGRCSITA